jgi:tripartite ATP-independent transporter DctM subunit
MDAAFLTHEWKSFMGFCILFRFDFLILPPADQYTVLHFRIVRIFFVMRNPKGGFMETIIGIFGILVMITLIFLGMNMGMAMFCIGFLGVWLADGSFNVAMNILRTVPYTNASNYSYSVVPLFILLGQAAYYSGISGGLYATADKWFSKAKGGLAVATVVACGGFGAICGSTTATAATMGTLALPEMRKYKYDDGLSTASIAAGGTLAYLIPPSTGFILYAIIAEQSIGRMFAAGIVPGVLLMIAYGLTVVFVCKLRPEYAPPVTSHSLKARLRSLTGIIPIAILFIAVIGGMFSGIFTANEAAAVGAFLGLLFMVVRKRFTVKSFVACTLETCKSVAMVFSMMLGAFVFGYFLTLTHLPQNLANFVSELNVSRYVVILVIIFIYVFLGCIMDALATILLTIPIFLPVVADLGFNPIWFGVVVVMLMMMGSITPPIGMNVFVIAGVAKDVPLTKTFRGVVPFCFTILVVILIVVLFPALSLWLPGLLYS